MSSNDNNMWLKTMSYSTRLRRDEGGNFSEWKNSKRCCYGRQEKAALRSKKNFQYRVSSQSPLAHCSSFSNEVRLAPDVPKDV
jgi:hypothetical protein